MRVVFFGFIFALAALAAACSHTPGSFGPDSGEVLQPLPFARDTVLPMQASDSYYIAAAEAVEARADGLASSPKAKNLILFVGDGMGISTITAGRIYAGQKRGVDGESYRLAMETLPYMALSKTYSHDFQISDSAATATAMVTGMKTRSGVLSVNQDTARSNCESQEGRGSDSLFELAEAQGLSTGIVSTARITHATPASAFAESADRNWESDVQTPEGCTDIARQLVEWSSGDGLEVAMGGGRVNFLPRDVPDPEYEGVNGARQDGRDLTQAWAAKSEAHKVVFDKAGFDAIDFSTSAKVLGLFEPSHMQYELDRAGDEAGEPSLADMTRAAITRLSQDQQGYVLMVEGGRIDHGHHAGNAIRALEDTDALDEAIRVALEMTDPADTLIVATADHSHTMTIAGYSMRGNPILGKSAYGAGIMARGADGLPYTTLGYANGPGACRLEGETDEAELDCSRQDLSDVDTTTNDFLQPALIPMGSETHAGEDVAVFARGPGASLVRGVIEQNEIFHIMGRMSGLVAGPERPLEPGALEARSSETLGRS